MTKRGVKITRETYFAGLRRIGLDSSVIIDLIANKELFSYKEEQIFSEEGLFVTHTRCVKEIKEWLVEKRDYNEGAATNEIIKFCKEHNIEIIEVNVSNKELLEWMKKESAEKNIEFHVPDSWIIADFKAAGVNKVYSTNNHFLDACHLFGMEAKKFPTVQKEIESQMRELFKQKFSRKQK
ncbi:hypothetical protein J4457_07165 [Candidatus Woesearchaeota archaeon]|nr:hypothetical protein [Candidatus Woesearchaeota archaeon]